MERTRPLIRVFCISLQDYVDAVGARAVRRALRAATLTQLLRIEGRSGRADGTTPCIVRGLMHLSASGAARAVKVITRSHRTGIVQCIADGTLTESRFHANADAACARTEPGQDPDKNSIRPILPRPRPGRDPDRTPTRNRIRPARRATRTGPGQKVKHADPDAARQPAPNPDRTRTETTIHSGICRPHGGQPEFGTPFRSTRYAGNLRVLQGQLAIPGKIPHGPRIGSLTGAVGCALSC